MGAAVVTVDTDEKPDVVERVDARQHPLRHGGQERAHDRVGARVLHDVELVRGDATVAGAADRDVLQLAPAVGHGDHVLRAGLGPADGTAEAAGQPAEEQLLGLAAGLGAEAAPDVRDHHPDLLRRQAVDGAERLPGRVRALAGRVVHQPAVVGPVRRPRSRLDGRCGHALVLDPQLEHHLAPAEVGPLRRRQPDGRVGPHLGKEDDLVGGRRLGVDGRGHRLVVDDHEVSGVGRGISVLRHDDGHGLADEAHHVGGQEGPAHAVGEHRQGVGDAGQLGDVGGGEHAQHPGRCARLVQVDGGDPGVGVGRPDVGHPGRAVERQVLDVGRRPGQEPGILHPLHAVAEDAHRLPLSAAPAIRSLRPPLTSARAQASLIGCGS